MGIVYNLQKGFFRFIGDIKWAGIKHPFWFIVNAKGYKLKGAHYRLIREIIEPGDILLRRFEGYVDKFFIPGYWNHAGIYIGDDGSKPEQVIHAVSEGVIQEDILNFMRTDHMIILRAEKGKDEALNTARAIVGKPYDFGFDFDEANRFSCTELVAYCYPHLDSLSGKLDKIRYRKYTIVADDLRQSPQLQVVWDSTANDKVTTMSIVQEYLRSRCPLRKDKKTI